MFTRTYETSVEDLWDACTNPERLRRWYTPVSGDLLQHATTLDSHEIGGEMFDAVYCMGGGYYPRLAALDQHLRGTLPEDYDSTQFHLNPTMRERINRGSAAMAALLAASG